ncbi:dTDP-4-dehydrorhamnose reductase [Christiangramia sabulilitoris]|uniref:dTDP-4-dehydrorhamnose reductase n=1 Tax=Christiangramia sabulilitoris TaxID=2583991 RepID=A0A550I8R4_9FLAO|nr:dTDP-4-dehydrorhamnose reductase [Christiangramia sabulilitoris]TRO67363.1 dTDP-4-dehydrorhamnose reductase [Christiangramia sabulilitoris]
MKTILVTGATGQLGQCLQKHSKLYPDFSFLFCSSRELDITSKEQLESVFKSNKIDYCINAAAYTNVEQAEKEREKAFRVNADAAADIAEFCREFQAKLIHISTDYVFNGRKDEAYLETDEVDPINVYGASKLKGEEKIQEILKEFFILRTSWLYSEFGHNFYNTILKKAEEKAELNITTSQVGTPTNANDLAKYILQIINSGSAQYGIYHVSNEGEATWYDFAKEILDYSGKKEGVTLNKTGFYQTLAERPGYSVLSKKKTNRTFGPVQNWKISLHQLIDEN